MEQQHDVVGAGSGLGSLQQHELTGITTLGFSELQQQEDAGAATGSGFAAGALAGAVNICDAKAPCGAVFVSLQQQDDTGAGFSSGLLSLQQQEDTGFGSGFGSLQQHEDVANDVLALFLSAHFVSSLSKISTAIPAATDVIKAEIGRTKVIIGSSRPYVTVMESTPVSGVAIRKAVVAPLLAPCSRRPAAAGITPQEHKGSGTPKSAALKTGPTMLRLCLPALVMTSPPRCLAINSVGKKAFNRPAMKKPNNI